MGRETQRASRESWHGRSREQRNRHSQARVPARRENDERWPRGGALAAKRRARPSSSPPCAQRRDAVGLVGRNVAALAEPPRIPRREITALTPAMARRILTAVRDDRLAALFTVAIALGLRQSEALGLRWDDINLEARTLTVRRVLQRYGGEFHLDEPKTRRSRRTIKMPRPVVTALREHRARQIEERLVAGPAWQGGAWGDLVFADESGGPLYGTSVGKRFGGLLQRAGLSSMRYHDLRHGAASLMAAQGVPARLAMEALGHADIGTTMNVSATSHRRRRKSSPIASRQPFGARRESRCCQSCCQMAVSRGRAAILMTQLIW